MMTGYNKTLYFACKRVRVRVWALMWTIAGQLRLARLFGIEPRRSRYDATHAAHRAAMSMLSRSHPPSPDNRFINRMRSPNA